MKKNDKNLQAALWMLLWSISFVALNICMKKLGDTAKPIVIWVRTALQLAILLPLLLYKKYPFPAKSQLPWLALRSLIAYPAIYCTYQVYATLPLSTATAIGFTEPIMAILLAALFMRLPIQPMQWLFIFIGYIGILCMSYPFERAKVGWIFIGLLANLFGSIAKLLNKQLTKELSVNQLMIYGKLFMFPIVSLLALPYYQELISLSATSLPWILGVTLISMVSQYCFTRALVIAHFDVIGPMTYTRLLFSVPLGALFFDEGTSYYAWLGGLLILVSNYQMIRRKKS